MMLEFLIVKKLAYLVRHSSAYAPYHQVYHRWNRGTEDNQLVHDTGEVHDSKYKQQPVRQGQLDRGSVEHHLEQGRE